MERTGIGAAPGRAPERSHAQRLQALARANQVRSERARVKAALRAGGLRVTELIADPPECLGSASLAEVLLAVPGVGKARLRRVLNACRLSPAQKLANLTARQREELVRALGERG